MLHGTDGLHASKPCQSLSRRCLPGTAGIPPNLSGHICTACHSKAAPGAGVSGHLPNSRNIMFPSSGCCPHSMMYMQVLPNMYG